jgi:hypothetical protein
MVAATPGARRDEQALDSDPIQPAASPHFGRTVLAETRLSRPPITAGQRLRIAFVTDLFDDVCNGGVRSARRFVAALAKRHEVVLVTSGPPVPGRVILRSFYIPGFRRLMREMGFAFAIPRRQVLEEAFRHVDVVHVQFPFWAGLRAAAIAREMGKPLVAAFHVQPENLLYNAGLRARALSVPLARCIYRFFVRSLYQLADIVICPSAFAAERLQAPVLPVPLRSCATVFRRTFARRPLSVSCDAATASSCCPWGAWRGTSGLTWSSRACGVLASSS